MESSQEKPITLPHDHSESFATGTEAEKIRTEIYRRMTPAEKWREACRLREAAWVLSAAGVRQRHPDWPETRVMQETRKMFLHATT